MIDTNQVQQIADTAAAVKQQVSNWWPTIAPLAYILGRELRAFNAWLFTVGEFVIKHGGIGQIIVKLIWNKNP